MGASALETRRTDRWAAQAALLALAGLTLAACAGGPRHLADTNAPGATGAPTSRYTGYKVGKPYQVKGVWYSPQEQPNYDEIGIASWYGAQFHNQYTADGEVFDMNMSSAAHKTLPLPSLVEVTNLANGRTLVVRVNDRGPFVDGRVIDMSKAAAEQLGFVAAGVTRVRVRYVGRAQDPPGLKTPRPNPDPSQPRQYKASLPRLPDMADPAMKQASAAPAPPVEFPSYGQAAKAAAPMAAPLAVGTAGAALSDVDKLLAEPVAGAVARTASLQPALSAPPIRAASLQQASLPQSIPQTSIPETSIPQNALPQARAPSPRAPGSAEPQTAAQSLPPAGYELQAGSFPDEAAAQHFASSLTGEGLPEVQPFAQGGQTVYKVVVHGLANPTAAAAARSEAMALGAPNPVVVSRF